MEGIELELDLARNVFGRISDEARERLRRYDADPTEDNWDDVSGLLVGDSGRMTVWQAWCAIDSTAPTTGRTTDEKGRILQRWRRWPDRETFRRALAYATH